MLLRRYRIRIGFRHPLHHLHIRHIEFVSTRRTLVRAHLTLHDHARFLGQPFDRFEHLGRNRILRHHPLDHPRAVAKLRKQQLPALPQVIQPPPQRNRLPVVLPNFRDSRYRRHKIESVRRTIQRLKIFLRLHSASPRESVAQSLNVSHTVSSISNVAPSLSSAFTFSSPSR